MGRRSDEAPAEDRGGPWRLQMLPDGEFCGEAARQVSAEPRPSERRRDRPHPSSPCFTGPGTPTSALSLTIQHHLRRSPTLSRPSATFRRHFMESAPRSDLQQALQPSPPQLTSSTVAPGVAAYLRGEASIVYLSNRIEAEYLAQGMAGAGYSESQLADGEPAWRIARAVEHMAAQAGLFPGAGAADFSLGDHAGQPAGSFASSSLSMPGSAPYLQQQDQPQRAFVSPAFAAPQGYPSASTSALFDPGAYYAAFAPQPTAPVASSRLDYSRAMQHHLSQQFASASLAESQQVFSSPAMMSAGFPSPLLHQAHPAGRPVEHHSQQQQQQQKPYNAFGSQTHQGYPPTGSMTPLTSIVPPSIAPPTTSSPKLVDRRASAGSTLATLPEASFGAATMW